MDTFVKCPFCGGGILRVEQETVEKYYPIDSSGEPIGPCIESSTTDGIEIFYECSDCLEYWDEFEDIPFEED